MSNRAERRRLAKQARKTPEGAARALQSDMTRATALHRAGEFREAADLYRRVLLRQPDHAEVTHLLGLALGQFGQSEAAAATLARAVELDPAKPVYWANLGKALKDAGNLAEAAEALHRALALDGTLQQASLTLGTVLFDLGQLDAAAEVFRGILAADPTHADSAYNLGRIAQDRGTPEQAAAHYEKALRLDPKHVGALGNLGVVLLALERPDDAVAVLERAVQVEPRYALAWYNLGLARKALGDLAASLAAYDRALAVDPDYASAHWNRSLDLLALGRLAEGWDEYEWRWRAKDFGSPPRGLDLPVWDGAPLGGRRLLIWAEQGLGDHINFCALLPEVAARARGGAGEGAVTVELDGRLIPLFARSFPDLRFLPPRGAAEAPAGFDLQLPMGSLPRLFRRAEADFPRRRGFLEPDPARVAALGARYRRLAEGRRLVGLSWRSGNQKTGPGRSLQLDELLTLLANPKYYFVSLQYGALEDELESLKRAHGIEVFRDETVDATGDIDGLAAQIAALDLVVTVGNVTAHVAGALGAPAWVLLPAAASWRWMSDRDDSPWYPSLRLLRQESGGDWGPPIARVADALGRPAG